MSCPGPVGESSEFALTTSGAMNGYHNNQLGDLQRRMKLRLTGEPERVHWSLRTDHTQCKQKNAFVLYNTAVLTVATINYIVFFFIVHSARNLVKKDLFSKCYHLLSPPHTHCAAADSSAEKPDPFAKIVVEGSGQCHCTEPIRDVLDPKWNQHYDLWVCVVKERVLFPCALPLSHVLYTCVYCTHTASWVTVTPLSSASGTQRRFTSVKVRGFSAASSWALPAYPS